MRRFIPAFLCAFLLWTSPAFSQAQQQEFEHQPASCGELGITLAQWGAIVLQTYTDPSTNSYGVFTVSPFWGVASGSLTCQATVQTYVFGRKGTIKGRSAAGVCPSGWSPSTETKDCVRPIVAECFVGQTTSKRWLIGWRASAGENSASDSDATVPTSYCDGTCQYAFDSLGDCFTANTASANGSYQVSCDVSYTSTGSGCDTPTDPPPVPDPPPPGNDGGDPDPGPDPGDDGGDPDPGPGDDGGEDGDTDSGECTPEQAAAGTCTPGTDGGDGGTTPGGTCSVADQALGYCSCTDAAGAPITCGTGTGSGPGGADDGSDDWGQPANIGTIYEKKDKTLESVLTDAGNEFKTSELGSSITSFFTIQGGGSCPTYSGNIPYIDVNVTLDSFCQPWVISAAVYIKAALLLVAAFFAFRVAFL